MKADELPDFDDILEPELLEMVKGMTQKQRSKFAQQLERFVEQLKLSVKKMEKEGILIAPLPCV